MRQYLGGMVLCLDIAECELLRVLSIQKRDTSLIILLFHSFKNMFC